MPDAPQGFGRRVADIRHARGLSRRSVAHAAGISDVSLMKLERGLSRPLLETAERLARALGVSLLELAPEDGR